VVSYVYRDVLVRYDAIKLLGRLLDFEKFFTLLDVTNTNKNLGWRMLFFGVRTRILLWYVVLMMFCLVISILTIRQVLLVRIEKRFEKSLIQEKKEFLRLVEGRNPYTGQPFGNEVAAMFDVFLSRNFTEEDEFLITLLNGKFYKSKSNYTVLPDSLNSNSDLVKHWAQVSERQQGEKVTSDGTIMYLAQPIVRGKTHGVFVVGFSTAHEYCKVDEVIFVAIHVTIVVIAVASVLAWVVAGRVLSPLRLLTETAYAITESDLTRRIPVQGKDEIAELTITFNEMLDRLQAAFSSQRDFINDAGHELRTPITIIRGHLELLGDDPQERRETIELVTDELDRMSRFVDDLLLLAKAEQPNFLYLETLEIGNLTEELYAKARALAERHWRLENKGTGRVVADRQRLTQAMMNLAQNATQHTKNGDTIALGSALIEGNAHFWVRDTGEGIAFADQQRIFERFARATNSRRRSEGAGLGLSIVRAIAQAHGGRVELLSQRGGGSTFTLVIPLDPPQEVLLHEPDSDRRR
jgi:signal transduction histidine kinase